MYQSTASFVSVDRASNDEVISLCTSEVIDVKIVLQLVTNHYIHSAIGAILTIEGD